MFRKRHPYRCFAALILVGYVAIAAAYVLIGAWVVASGYSNALWRPSLAQAFLPRLNDVFVFTFFLVFGASVGSFLNVVVWRLPQGRSVNGHSFCPHCRHRLRARDNVPVLGWLWLQGRCRDCRLPISPRYPLVEAAVGISFAVLGTVELYGGNLPYRSRGGSFLMVSPLIDSRQLMTVGYHLVGLAICWAMGLIRYDGNRIPARLVVFTGIWLIGAMLLMPSLAIVPWQLATQGQFAGLGQWPPEDWFLSMKVEFAPATLVNTLVRILTALVAAVFFARVLARGLCRQADLKLDPLGEATKRLMDLVKLIAVVSILVGWQASSGVVIAASLMATVFRSVFRRGDALGRFSLALPVALLFQLVFWRQLIESGWWPSEQASRGVLLAYGLGTLLIPIWLYETPRPGLTSEQPDLDFGRPDEHSEEWPHLSVTEPPLPVKKTP